MANSKFSIQYSFEEFFQEKSLKTVKDRVRIFLFSTFNQIFEAQIPSETISILSKCVATGVHLCISFQITSLLWRSDINIQNWADYEIFWRALSFSRIDLCCAYLNLVQEALLAVNCLLLVIFLSLLTCQALILSNRAIFFSVRAISTSGIKLMSTIFFIPLFEILLIDLKYYFSTNATITEYSVQNQSSGNSLSLARSSVSLLFVMTGNVIFEYFGSEIRHTAKDKVIYAKSSMYVDLQVKFLYATLVVVNTFTYELHPQLFQILVLACSCYNSLQCMQFLPYYSMYINKLRIMAFSIESIAALAFLIGYLADDSQTLLVIAIFTTPCGCIIMNSLIENRRSSIKDIDIKHCKPFMLELLLREDLADASNRDREILTKIDKSFFINNFKDCQLMGVWQAYYCMNVLGDYRMAFIKLSKCWSCDYSLAANFQTFKCSYMMNSIDFMKYEDLSYIRYAITLENLKKEDMKVCISLLNFWGELIDQGDLQALSTLVDEAADRIASVQDQYQYLIENYPSSNNCREFFRTFLHDIVSEFTLLDNLTSKMNSNKEYINPGTINYFDDSNGVIIVSGNKANIGEVTYSNYRFAEMLDQQLNTIIGRNIASFIPELYSKNHDQNLDRFVNYCVESEVSVSGTLFLQTSKGYMVECMIKLRCSAINSNTFFLVILKQIESKRHIILHDKQGIIFSYSKDLPELLGFKNLKMMKMEDIFDFSIDSMDINVNYIISYNGRALWVSKTYRKVANTLMSVYLIYESEEEVNRCGQDFETFQEATENLKHTPEIESTIKYDNQKQHRVVFADDRNHSLSIIKESTGVNDGDAVFDKDTLLEKQSPKTSQTSTVAESSNERYSNKILLAALRRIKLYKWILLIFVRDI